MGRWGGGQMREKVILLSPHLPIPLSPHPLIPPSSFPPSPHPLIPPSSFHAPCPFTDC
ncbi:MAG: hypothetical protein RMY29_004645 [Nostoc sp. CreGUA01]